MKQTARAAPRRATTTPPEVRRAATRPKIQRGELWAVDFEPQSHREEPGKTGRPALVLQTDALNRAGHASTIVIPGTGKLVAIDGDDQFPMRVRLRADVTNGLRQNTDLLIDQVRAVSNRRLLMRLGVTDARTLERVQQALGWLIGGTPT